jgi:hypothetical protein
MSELKLLQTFKNQIIKFLDELIEQFPTDAEFVLIRVFVKDQIPLGDVLGRFIKECLPHHQQIKNKNESFFLESDIIVSALGGSKMGMDVMEKLKSLWRSERLDNDDRDMIWKWMGLFFQIAETYKAKYGYVVGWEP